MTPHTLTLPSRVAKEELRRHGLNKRHGHLGGDAYQQWPLANT